MGPKRSCYEWDVATTSVASLGYGREGGRKIAIIFIEQSAQWLW